MIFNSLSFFIFFSIIFLLYFFLRKVNAQNWLLLLSSYFFYGFANWKIVPILLIATIVFYVLGIVISNSKNSNKSFWLTTIGVISGVGLLIYFKYFNFFIDSFSSMLNAFGLKSNVGTFNIILPIGISFFTFKLISYVIEIYRGKIGPSKDFVIFSTFVAFFPTILSGPIDRPNEFIPQLQKKRSFNYSLIVDGCRQILWGLFQKVVIADSLAMVIDDVWGDIAGQPGSALFITTILYSIQIYTDFSGYSHMAIGVGKILGFRITKNFNYPFFAKNIAEFWRNWHMSLTSWLTDYIFIPLNIRFRDYGNWGIIIAVITNMVLVGVWHGANWTFVVFGLFHGFLFIPLILTGTIFKKKKIKTNKLGLPIFKDLSKMLVTFLLVTLSLIFFRAESLEQAWEYITGIIDMSIISIPSRFYHSLPPLFFSVIFFISEWYNRDDEYPLANLGLKWKQPLFRYMIYYAIIIAIFRFDGKEQQFIYFQF